MTKKPKGRPPDPEKEKRNADRVFLRLARDRSLARMSSLGGENPLSGRKLKGQQRSPRSMSKEVLPEVAAEIRALPMEDQEKLSPGTVERHYRKHGAGAMDRIVSELHNRLNAYDGARQAELKALLRLHDDAVKALLRLQPEAEETAEETRRHAEDRERAAAKVLEITRRIHQFQQEVPEVSAKKSL